MDVPLLWGAGSAVSWLLCGLTLHILSIDQIWTILEERGQYYQ
jgi:hypothetical protein